MLSGRLTGCALSDTWASTGSKHAWREIEVLLLAVLVLGVYFSRLTALTIRGEESRWARVAQEMVETGDWIVPRQQGEPFPDRPPLNSWAMIAAAQWTGGLNLAAVRLPSGLATLFATLLIYVYARNSLSRAGALASGAAYATMAQILQLGRVGESDALLTLCVSGSLFAWHYGYACRANPKLAWSLGYALAGLAGLIKGPQGPVYFVAITVIYLAIRRDWQFLFSRWHLAGVAVLLLVVGAWQVPFSLAVDSSSMRAVWSEGGTIGERFHYFSFGRAMRHWLSYPFEVFACLMPWSFLLPVLVSRWLRRNVGEALPMVTFLLTACAVAFPTCWLPAESRPRYLMSLYPCVAPLVGLVVQRSWESREAGWWQRSWDRFLLAGTLLIVVAALAVTGIRLLAGSRLEGLAESMSPAFVAAYAVSAVAAVCATLWSRAKKTVWRAHAGILALAAFMGLSYTGVVIDMQVHTSNDPEDLIAAVRAAIPTGERLVSFGPVHHLFAHYYQQPISLEPLVDGSAPASSTATYFCYAEDPSAPTVVVPFAWERWTEISCERARSDRPRTKVVIGKRRWDRFDSLEESTAMELPPSLPVPPGVVKRASHTEPLAQ